MKRLKRVAEAREWAWHDPFWGKRYVDWSLPSALVPVEPVVLVLDKIRCIVWIQETAMIGPIPAVVDVPVEEYNKLPDWELNAD